jgi:hypothetical protein
MCAADVVIATSRQLTGHQINVVGMSIGVQNCTPNNSRHVVHR